MAETIQQTQIAQHLTRIENAKETLLDKALNLNLEYYDPEEGLHTKRFVEEDDNISILADAFDQIPHYPSPNPSEEEPQVGEPNADGITVNGRFVYLSDGYYTGGQRLTIKQGSVGHPTITVDPETGKITASAATEEGYIGSGESIGEGFVQHANLVAENIKDGTTIFGIEGTFTSDANATSNRIVKDFSAYVNGQKVEGSIPDNGDMGVRTFNPLVDDYWSINVDASTGAVVKGLQVGLSNELLTRLRAI